MKRLLMFLVLAIVFTIVAAPATAASPITITSNKFSNNFRKDLVFQVQAENSAAQITRVDLLVQIDDALARSRFAAAFSPGSQVQATYAWNLGQNYLPPGVTGQYWWEIQDSAGNQVQSPQQNFRVEDQTHVWKNVANAKLAVYWYTGDDNVIVIPSAAPVSDNANIVALVFGAVSVFLTLVSLVFAFILRRHRALLIVFVLVALGLCVAPLFLVQFLGVANPSVTLSSATPVSFGQALFDRGVNAIAYLERDTGVTVTRQIQVYVYGNRGDFFNAIEPGAQEWTGGRAYPEYGIVMIDISPQELDWGERAIAHEITHQVIHQAIRSPLSELSLPPMMDEGLAVYYESPGSPDPQFVGSLRQAIRNNTIIPLRSLTSAFPADPDAANLSYAESYSVVDFIFRHYGDAKMGQLLQAYKQGGLTDDIFTQVLGVNLDGLEAEWRADIGAQPRAVQTRSLATPTPFPTFSLSTEATPTPAR